MSTPCDACNGRGYVYLDDARASTCHCVIIRGWISTVRRTPGLEKFQQLGRGLAHLRGNALVRCAWPAMVDHTAGWLFGRLRAGESPLILLTTCADIRTMAAGGSGGGASKLEGLRSYDLVVIRLLGQRNKFTADALLEALTYARVCWLVYSPGREFKEGHPAWSPEIGDELERYERVDLGPPKENPDDVFAELGVSK